MFGGKRTRKNKTVRKGGNWKMYGGAVEPSFGGALGTAGPLWGGVSTATPYSSSTGGAIPDPYSTKQSGGRRHRKGMSAKTMRRMLKKNGLKVSGRKSTLTKRMKKAKLMKGGAAQYLPAGASAGFAGTGSRGMADYKDVSGSAPRANDVVPLRG